MAGHRDRAPLSLAAPPHLRALGRYRTDREAWRAVADDPNLMIVDDFFLQTAGGPSTRRRASATVS